MRSLLDAGESMEIPLVRDGDRWDGETLSLVAGIRARLCVVGSAEERAEDGTQAVESCCT